MQPNVIELEYIKTCMCEDAPGTIQRFRMQTVKNIGILGALADKAEGNDYKVQIFYDPGVICDNCKRPWTPRLTVSDEHGDEVLNT